MKFLVIPVIHGDALSSHVLSTEIMCRQEFSFYLAFVRGLLYTKVRATVSLNEIFSGKKNSRYIRVQYVRSIGPLPLYIYTKQLLLPACDYPDYSKLQRE